MQTLRPSHRPLRHLTTGGGGHPTAATNDPPPSPPQLFAEETAEVGVSQKTCRKCGRVKPGDGFARNAKTLDQLSSWCKECHRQSVRDTRAERKDVYNARRRGKLEQRRGMRALLASDPTSRAYLECVLGDPCAYCGDSATDIDHIVPFDHDRSGDWSNIAAACRSCNARKRDLTLLAFLMRRPLYEQRARIEADLSACGSIGRAA